MRRDFEAPTTVNLTIDGKQVNVPEGTTILEAAQANDIYIPYLCHHPRISEFGSCRMCVVSIEGSRGFKTSCSTIVKEGMNVTTNSPEILAKRRTLLELLLVHHPLDCPVCDRPGECELHEVVYELELENCRFSAERKNRPVDRSNPFIERNYNRCTLCGRCVRICEEVQGVGALSFNKRGFETEVGSAFGRSFECENCGQCMSVCLVGSINDKVYGRRAVAWELEKIKSICPYCGVGCTLQLNVKDDEVFRVTTHHKLGFNNGNLCVKGRFGWNMIYGDGRVREPMVKAVGGFKAASWEEALQTVADKFSEIKQQHGHDAIGGFGSARCTNEDNYVLQKFMRTVIGTNNLDSSTSLVNNNITVPLEDAFGWGGATNTYEQVLAAQAIIVIGDISESHPVFGLQIQKVVRENDAKLIVLSPKRVKLDKFATLSVRHRVSQEHKVLMAIAAELVSQNLINEDFVNNRTSGFDKFKEYLGSRSVKDLADEAGISVGAIKEAVSIISKAEGAMFVFNRYTSMATTQLVVNLALMTGNVGKFGAGVMPLLEFNNNQGMRDMGVMPGFLPGYEAVADSKSRRNFEMAWGSAIPGNPGRNVVEMIDDINQGRIKALYIMGDNPINHIAPSIKEVLSQLDFLVVQDMFFDEVAELADIVLPACSFAEKDGTFTNTDRRIQMLNKAVSPFANSKPDWWITSQLAAKMGHDMKYKSAHEIMSEISLVNILYGGVDYKNLDERGVHWPCATQGSIGECILYQESFGHKDKANFLEISAPRLIETPERFNLDLISGPSRTHSGSISRRAKQLSEFEPDAYIKMHPEDAKSRGLKNGDLAKVESATGTITARVKTTDNIVAGSVFVPNHFVENSPALLTYPSYDEVKKVMEYPPIRVKVSKKKQ